MNRKQEIGETEEEEEKKPNQKITWKTPNQWDKKNQKTSSTQVQGVTAAPQMMQLLHKWAHNRKETNRTVLTVKRRQDPVKHFMLLQRRAPRDILSLVFLFKSKLVFTALLAIPQQWHPLCPLFRHVPWALGKGLDRDAPPTLDAHSFCTEPQRWAAF